MRYVILANDKQYECDWCGYGSGALSMNLFTKESFVELTNVFSNSANTAKIEFHYGDKIDIFEGYVNLTSIQIKGWSNSGVLITLKKDVT